MYPTEPVPAPPPAPVLIKLPSARPTPAVSAHRPSKFLYPALKTEIVPWTNTSQVHLKIKRTPVEPFHAETVNLPPD